MFQADDTRKDGQRPGMRGEGGAKAAEVEQAGVELRFTIGAQALQDGREAVAELAEAERERVAMRENRSGKGQAAEAPAQSAVKPGGQAHSVVVPNCYHPFGVR